jgi:hypothetical protein
MIIIKEAKEIYYHGSDKKFDSFNIKTSKRGKAIFLTKDYDYAKIYGKYIYTVELDNTTKLFDYKDKLSLKKLEECILNYLELEKLKRSDLRDSFYPFSVEKVFEGLSLGKYNFLGLPIVSLCLKKLKYDGWIELENASIEQIGVFNTKKLKILFYNLVDS